MKMKYKLTTFIFALLVSVTVSSQVTDTTYMVTFERKVNDPPCFGILVSLQVTTDYSFLKNIPDIACDISAITSFKMNQYVEPDSIPNQIYLFIGVNESKKEKYVVVDANNNHDFSDDRLYTFSLPDKPLTREEKAERAVSLKITPDPNKNNTVNIGVDPFNYFPYTYPSTQDKRLEVIIVFTEYMEAQTQIEGTPVVIQAIPASSLFQRDLDEETNFNIIYHDKANKQIHKNFSAAKDTFQINDRLYKLSKIDHPNIYLKEISAITDSSYSGSLFPAVHAKDINNKNIVSVNDLIKNKYVFIDFWGSWCGPCIQSIPELKSLYEKIKGRADVLMLGIAYENDEKDVEKVKEIINSNKMRWLNLWHSTKEQNITTSIIKKLNINAFPTYLIIDNTGKIVYKEDNSKNTQGAIAFFEELIKK